jgi:hypothetical protein
MKIKYRMKDKKHDTHLIITNMKISQVASIIAYLDKMSIDFEYVNSNV